MPHGIMERHFIVEISVPVYAFKCHTLLCLSHRSVLGRIIRVTQEVDEYREWIKKNWGSQNDVPLNSTLSLLYDFIRRIFEFLLKLHSDSWKGEQKGTDLCFLVTSISRQFDFAHS